MKLVSLLSLIMVLIISSCNYIDNKHVTMLSLSVVTKPKSNTDSLCVRYLNMSDSLQRRVAACNYASITADGGGISPLLWYNYKDCNQSRIIGACANNGIVLCDLNGNKKCHLGTDHINSIDVRYGLHFNGECIDVAVVTNTSSKSINLLKVTDSCLTQIATKNLSLDTTLMIEPNECCLYKSPVDTSLYAFISGKKGFVQQWKIHIKDTISIFPVRILYFGEKCNGMVADDENGLLYVAAELDGIYRVNAEPSCQNPSVKIALGDSTNQNLAYNLKGLDIYYGLNGNGYLIASSAKNNSYTVFKRQVPNDFLGSFVIDSRSTNEIVKKEDISIINLPLDSVYDQGVMLANNGIETDSVGNFISENFKLVKWDLIANVFKEKLEINTSYYPLVN